jgi:hypothetical protein
MKTFLISILAVLSMVANGAVPSTLYPVPNDSTMTLQIKSTATLAEMFNRGIPVTFTNSVSGTFSISPTNTLGVSNFPNPNRNVTNTVAVTGNIGGFTLVTNMSVLVDTTAGGIVANDVLAPQLEITNAVRTTGGTGILRSIGYVSGNNLAPAIRLLICSRPITWPVTNAVANIQAVDFPYILGTIEITNTLFKPVGTNWLISVDSNIGIKCATNSLFVYTVCGIARTNTVRDNIIFTIVQD